MRHLTAVFQYRNLPAGLIVNRRLHEAHGVHILNFAARAEVREILRGLIFLVVPRPAHRDIDIGPQAAVLHIAIAGAEILHDLAQLGDIGRRLFRAANVWAADDLHQGDAGAVEIHK